MPLVARCSLRRRLVCGSSRVTPASPPHVPCIARSRRSLPTPVAPAPPRPRFLRSAMAAPEPARAPDYDAWPKPDLVARVRELEAQLSGNRPPRRPRPLKAKRAFDSSRYSSRLVAFKFAYLGAGFNGFEYHARNTTPLPTVEEEIFKALLKARLVPADPDAEDPESSKAWPGDDVAEYSKCGRTDRGVSGFGQVIAVRLRSARPLPKQQNEDEAIEINGEERVAEKELPANTWDDSHELPYALILNRLLPPTIRILAYCISPPLGFSARFNCVERQYRYFFTSPALAPLFPPLDINAMNEAAAHFLGEHDFRNLCKLDASKQIDNFVRKINHSRIHACEEESGGAFMPSGSELTSEQEREESVEIQRIGNDKKPATAVRWYYFALHGSGFLWHQVRHMIAVLFLVGQHLEPPRIVSDLLDVTKFPRKPMYEMAIDRPLVLWDCVFPDGMLNWEPADTIPVGPGARDGVVDTVWSVWKRAKLDEVLAGALMELAEKRGGGLRGGQETGMGRGAGRKQKENQIMVFGGEDVAYRGAYEPLEKRKTMRDIKEINAAWVEKKGVYKPRAKRKAEEAALVDTGNEVE